MRLRLPSRFASPLPAAMKSVLVVGTLHCPHELIHQATSLGHDPILGLAAFSGASFLFVLFWTAFQGGIHRRREGPSLCRPRVVHTVVAQESLHLDTGAGLAHEVRDGWTLAVIDCLAVRSLAMNPGIKATPRAVTQRNPTVWVVMPCLLLLALSWWN